MSSHVERRGLREMYAKMDGKSLLEQGKDPDVVFATHARQLEALGFKEAIAIINHSPLIMFSKEKAVKALEWGDANSTEVLFLPFEQFTIVDSISAVSVLESKLIRWGEPSHSAVFEELYRSLEKPVRSSRMKEPEMWQGPMPEEAMLMSVVITMCTVPVGADSISITHWATGLIAVNPKRKFYVFMGMDNNSAIFIDGKMVQNINAQGLPPEFTADIVTNVCTMMSQVQYMSKSRDVIAIESTPHRVREPKKMIIRAHERARVVLLDPDEVRKIRPSLGGTHASPIPHTRRGHKRRFFAERYKKMRGKTIWINSFDVKGGDAWEFGSRRYKVIERHPDEGGDGDETMGTQENPENDKGTPERRSEGASPQRSCGADTGEEGTTPS